MEEERLAEEEDAKLAALGPKLGHLGYTIAALARERANRSFARNSTFGLYASSASPALQQPIEDTTPTSYGESTTPFGNRDSQPATIWSGSTEQRSFESFRGNHLKEQDTDLQAVPLRTSYVHAIASSLDDVRNQVATKNPADPQTQDNPLYSLQSGVDVAESPLTESSSPRTSQRKTDHTEDVECPPQACVSLCANNQSMFSIRNLDFMNSHANNGLSTPKLSPQRNGNRSLSSYAIAITATPATAPTTAAERQKSAQSVVSQNSNHSFTSTNLSLSAIHTQESTPLLVDAPPQSSQEAMPDFDLDSDDSAVVFTPPKASSKRVPPLLPAQQENNGKVHWLVPNSPSHDTPISSVMSKSTSKRYPLQYGTASPRTALSQSTNIAPKLGSSHGYSPAASATPFLSTATPWLFHTPGSQDTAGRQGLATPRGGFTPRLCMDRDVAAGRAGVVEFAKGVGSISQRRVAGQTQTAEQRRITAGLIAREAAAKVLARTQSERMCTAHDWTTMNGVAGAQQLPVHGVSPLLQLLLFVCFVHLGCSYVHSTWR